MAVRRVSDGGVLRLLRTRALSRLARFDRVLGEVRFAFELVAPTSVVVQGTGSSASVVGAGSVDFASATSLSLNGVFSAEYDNYMVALRYNASASAAVLYARMRSGTDNTTANSYVAQELKADNTAVTGVRTTSNQANFGAVYSNQRSGVVAYVYGPYLAQPTALRTVSVLDYLAAYINDNAITHNQSVQYDGISLYPASGTFTGNIAVYGLRG